ncbi:DUF334 domain-containing protein [Staphylococcus ureilyticus]
MQENQKTREKEQETITSKLQETAEAFRSSGIQAHNDFVDIAKEKLGKVNTEDIQAEIRKDIHKVRESHEHYQKRQKQLFTGIGAMLLVFMLFALIMTIGSDFMSFLHVDTLQNVIASKIRASEVIWYIGLWLALYIRYRIIYWLV